MLSLTRPRSWDSGSSGSDRRQLHTARGASAKQPGAPATHFPNAYFKTPYGLVRHRPQTNPVHNQPNRRVRTRMHGGVTGKAREGLPMSISTLHAAHWHGPSWTCWIQEEAEELTSESITELRRQGQQWLCLALFNC